MRRGKSTALDEQINLRTTKWNTTLYFLESKKFLNRIAQMFSPCALSGQDSTVFNLSGLACIRECRTLKIILHFCKKELSMSASKVVRFFVTVEHGTTLYRLVRIQKYFYFVDCEKLSCGYMRKIWHGNAKGQGTLAFFRFLRFFRRRKRRDGKPMRPAHYATSTLRMKGNTLPPRCVFSK